MRYLRNPISVKAIVAFFIVNFLGSVFLPTYSYALTGGPHQIEYTTYEEPGATDMVNLLTGDFAYNLPILEVPGPEGSFSLPLSYHAGIGLDQEASWVGLGWSMNAGAIVRNINEFPDDASGESQSVTVQDLNVIRGWDSNLGIVKFGWNSQDGHYGSVNLFNIVSVSWNNGIKSVGIVGIMVSDGGVSFDPVMFISAVMTVATWGAGGAIEGGKIVAQEAVKAAAIDATVQLAFGAAMGGATPNVPTAGYWKHTKKTQKKLFRTKYRIWLNHTRIEDMYGTLYLGSVTNYASLPTSDFGVAVSLMNGGTTASMQKFDNGSNTLNKGSASDINYHIDDNKEYFEVNNPAVLAYDDYQVYGSGVSGAISPYRLDVGSVSMPRQMNAAHARLAPVKYENYKVPFQYEGVPANSYFHHVGGASAVSSPSFYDGVSHTVGSTNLASNNLLRYNLDDVVLKNERIRNDINGQKKIATGNHIEWLNNFEIKNSTTYSSKFIDFLHGGAGNSDRYLFRSNFTLGGATPSSGYVSTNSFSRTLYVTSSFYDILLVGDIINLTANIYENPEDHAEGIHGQSVVIPNLLIESKVSYNGNYIINLSDHPSFTTYGGAEADITLTCYKTPQIQNAIGGYVITAQDGTSYHYALPVYDYGFRSDAIDATDDNKKSIINREQAFANTWLLTAITYADFIDRNNNGLADDGDWGGWIKLNYGKHTDEYKWRGPHEEYKRDPENKTNNYSEGTKQLYYLNSIETRSHVALFLKSGRTDAIGKNGATPLKLDEICLLSKEHYTILKTQFGVPSYSNQIANVCLSSQFSLTTVRDFLNKNSQKRVVFTYTNDLCQGAPNSTGSPNGKLTLTKISIKGRGSDVSIVPDYKFEYGYNPSYSKHKWDGWGFYNPAGQESGTTHKPSQMDQDGAAWSLKKIITPLGSEIEVNYERDVYAHVSGNVNPVYSTPMTDMDLSDQSTSISYTSESYFSENERVKIDINVYFYCPPEECDMQQLQEPEMQQLEGGECGGDQLYERFGTISGTQVQLDFPFTPLNGLCANGTQSITWGTVSRLTSDRKGGDLRVASIVMRDEFGIENKIRYLYTKTDGSSSGVMAKDNPYDPIGNYSFENWPEYPDTPVMYGTVTVLNGKLADDGDYHTRTVYEFETPNQNLVINNTYNIIPTTTIKNEMLFDMVIGTEKLTMKRHTIENHTAKIGNLKSIKVYDASGITPKTTTEMVYTNEIINDASNNYQGIYSHGTLMFDRIKVGNEYHHKMNKTTVLRYAYVLKDVITTKDGNTNLSENKKWDFITGNVLEKVETSALGVRVKSVTIPAYKISPQYAEFGSKAFNINNKNMLSQIAAEYTYLLDPAGNEVGLLSGSAQTWKKDWSTYRVFDSGTGTYSDGAEGAQIWRKGPAYIWKGDYSRLRADGSQTFSSPDQFSFASGANNAGWQYLGEVLRYDHYNMPLETKDLKNIRSVSKMGYNDKIKILSASNAEFGEVTFSSAEDLNTTTGFFGAEVALKNSGGNATVVKKSSSGDSHTGDCAISLSTGYGFVYKAYGLKPDKTYRASVWTNSTNGRIYYKLNGGAEQLSLAPTTQTKSGNWYLINYEIPIGSTFTSLEVGVKSSSGTVLFDDFRFQPVDASMICYVYNPLDYVYTNDLKYSDYVLDNDNLYTRYLYNERGQLFRTYRESIKYNGEKLVSESNSDYRRFHVNQ